MCGILGGNVFKDIGEVKNGLTSMFHRGTDGNSIFQISILKNCQYFNFYAGV